MKLAGTLLLLGIILLVPATWMTLNRHEGYNAVLRSYAELQAPLKHSTIQSLNLKEGSDGEAVLNVTTADITPQSSDIALEPGIFRHQESAYSITTVYGGGNSVIVNNASLPLGQTTNYVMEDFVTSNQQIDQARSESTQQILRQAGAESNANSLTTVGTLATFLHHQLFEHQGEASPVMRMLDGHDQYLEAVSGRSKVLCANQAAIFAYFANAAGVPTRLVDVGGTFNGNSIAEHAFAESYIKELKKWAYVDLQLGVAYVTDAEGTPLNGIDLLISHKRNTASDMVAFVMSNGRLTQQPYSSIQEMNSAFIPPEATLTYLWGGDSHYSTINRLVRLLVNPQPAFSLRLSGSGTYWRLFFTYLSLALIGLGLCIGIVSFSRKLRPNREKGLVTDE